MHTMTDNERRTFLSGGTRTAILGTVRLDGRAHLAPVWFVLDGDDILFNTGETTVKGKNLRRDPRVTLCVDEAVAPYAYVQIEGTASLSDDPADLLHWATRIGGRYMGEEHAEQFGRRNGVPGELLVRVTPTKMIALAGIAD